MKYFAKNNSFVPEKDACAEEGYTAEKIFKRTNLNELQSFELLLDIRNNPKKALEKLEELKNEKR